MNAPEQDQLAQDQLADDALHRRLRRNMILVIVLSLFIAGVWAGKKMVLGVALGSALSFLNLRWLTGSVRSILSAAVFMQNGRVPPFTAGKLIFRYYLVAFIIGAAVWTGDFHPLGIGVGFAAYVGGVMIEAAYRLLLIVTGRDLPEKGASIKTIKE